MKATHFLLAGMVASSMICSSVGYAESLEAVIAKALAEHPQALYPSYLKMQGCWLLSATAPRLWLPASPYLLYPYSRALLYLLHPCSRRQLLLGSGFLLRPISYIHIVVRCSTSCIHAVVTHPNHLLLVGSWGFAQLPPTCISNSNGYSRHESLAGSARDC